MNRMAAEMPEVKPDVLIIEATYGVQSLAPVAQREKLFQGECPCVKLNNVPTQGAKRRMRYYLAVI